MVWIKKNCSWVVAWLVSITCPCKYFIQLWMTIASLPALHPGWTAGCWHLEAKGCGEYISTHCSLHQWSLSIWKWLSADYCRHSVCKVKDCQVNWNLLSELFKPHFSCRTTQFPRWRKVWAQEEAQGCLQPRRRHPFLLDHLGLGQRTWWLAFPGFRWSKSRILQQLPGGPTYFRFSSQSFRHKV